MSFFKEFRDFAFRGNMIDMAVGIVIGVVFGKVVSSFVSDILMPPIGLLIGRVDFKNLSLVIKEGATATETVSIRWGAFITTLIDFLIVAFAIFLVVTMINKLTKAKKEMKRNCPECCMEIPEAATRCCHCGSKT